MVRWGQSAPPDVYEALVRRTERTLKTAPRQRPEHVKDRIVRERGFNVSRRPRVLSHMGLNPQHESSTDLGNQRGVGDGPIGRGAMLWPGRRTWSIAGVDSTA